MKKNFTLFAVTLLLLIINCTSIKAQFTNDQAASLVMGEPNFTTATDNMLTQSRWGAANGAIVDQSGNLYVSDGLFNRVMIYKNVSSKSNGANADFELGQADFTTDNRVTPSQNGFNENTDVCVDASGNLYVIDLGDNRILIFKGVTGEVNAETIVNGANADYVLGQTDFVSSTTNTSQNGLFSPTRATVDASGNLYVADGANNRVLIFKNIVSKVNAGTLVNGANADYVLGQPDFVSGTTAISQSSMDGPSGLAVDGQGNLYVSDAVNNRVMIFKGVTSSVNAGTLTNGANADFVLGQSGFTSSTHLVPQANTFNVPGGLAVDAAGNLYVADVYNNRILIFDGIAGKVSSGTVVNDANADIVLGQSTFTTSASGLTAESLSGPSGIGLDASGDLFVADANNIRVLEFTNSLLPVSLISFSATMPNQSTVNLAWATASEENADHFELMRSVDGIHFSNIASVPASGNSSITRNYNYLDNIAKISFAGDIYYQLSEVDINGKTQLSPVVSVTPEENISGVNLWPNPFSDHVQLSVGSDAPKTIMVSLISTDGKIVYKQSYSLAKGENQISILNLENLSAGIYQLVGFDQGKILFNKKMVKQ